MNIKKCNLCLQEKNTSLFSVDKRSKSGFQTRCKDCQAKVKKSLSVYYRSKHLEYKYGLTVEDYENLLIEQEHKCAICGIEEKYAENARLCVDHNHNTGEVRALLCKKCNQGLGLFQDNPDFCEAAGRYLRKHG